MNILNWIYGKISAAVVWIAAGVVAILAPIPLKTKVIGAAIIAFVAVIWLFVLPGSSSQQKGLRQFSQARLSFFDTFWKQKETVEILINGDLKDAVITPPAIEVKAGQKIAIEVIEGMIAQKPKIAGKSTSVNPAEVIKFKIPGEDGEFRLNDKGLTELTIPIKQGGKMEFGVQYFNLNPSSFYTVERNGKKFKLAHLKLRIVFLNKLTGKGGPPKKIEDLKDLKMPKIPGLPDMKEIIHQMKSNISMLEKQVDRDSKKGDESILSEEDIKILRSLRDFGVLTDINPSLINQSSGICIIPCGDGDRFSDIYHWHEELMAKQSEMLKETIQRVVSSSSSGTISVTKQDKDDELFIPDVIKSREMTANLSFEEKSTGSIDEATAALKAMKKGKSNVSG